MRVVKSVIRRVLRHVGYDIHKVCVDVRSSVGSVSPDVASALTVKESEYYSRWAPPCPLFSPWTGHSSFQAVYSGIAPYTLVTPDRCYALACLARHGTHIRGDFAECGVFKGGTALLLCRVLGATKKKLYLFDSFQGLPKEDPAHDNCYRQGDFLHEDVDSVRQLLKEFEDRTNIRQGWIPSTFAGLEENRFAFAHIDVDLYRSALDCCNYFYDRLTPGGMLVFDDYGFPACRGEKDAVDTFFADKPEKPWVLPTGQAVVLKIETKEVQR